MLVTRTRWALFWPAAMIVWGPGLTCATHRHHAIQLVMALTGTVRIRSGPDQRWRRCAAALVRPDAPHEVDAGGAQICLRSSNPKAIWGPRCSKESLPLSISS